MSITSIRRPVSRSRGLAIIGIALDTFAWSVTVSAAMTSDSAGDSDGMIAFSWLMLVIVDLVACGVAVWLTRRAARDAKADILVDIALFLARVSLIGVLGIALFMFAL